MWPVLGPGRLQTADGEKLIIPNRDVVSSKIYHFGAGVRSRSVARTAYDAARRMMRATTWPSALGGGSCTGARGPSASAHVRVRARPFAGDAQTSCDANGPARSAHDGKASRGPSHGPSSPRPLATAARSRSTERRFIRTNAAVVARPWWTRRDRGHTAAHATVRGSSLCSARSLSECYSRAFSAMDLLACLCLFACLFVDCLWVALGCAVVLRTGHEGRPRADTGCRCGPALVQGRRFVQSPRALPAPPSFPYFPCPRSLARSGSLPPPSSSFSPGLFLSVLPSAGQNG